MMSPQTVAADATSFFALLQVLGDPAAAKKQLSELQDAAKEAIAEQEKVNVAAQALRKQAEELQATVTLLESNKTATEAAFVEASSVRDMAIQLLVKAKQDAAEITASTQESVDKMRAQAEVKLVELQSSTVLEEKKLSALGIEVEKKTKDLADLNEKLAALKARFG